MHIVKFKRPKFLIVKKKKNDEMKRTVFLMPLLCAAKDE